MKALDESISIVRCRASREGLLLKFNDGQVYLFHTSFLIANRLHHADRLPSQVSNGATQTIEKGTGR